MYRILIVDDQPLFAGGLKKLFSEKELCSHADFEAAGGDFTNVLSGLAYDLALINVSFCEKELLQLLTNNNPEISILAISEKEIKNNHWSSLGIHGYVIRKSSEEKVVKTIRELMAGRKVKGSRNGSLERINLSSREKELLTLICEGYTNPEIACKLFLGEETIKSYRKNLLAKLNARNTAVLVRIAIEQNLL